MSRTSLPLYADDISSLARSLRSQLGSYDRTPGHVELLNMLSRSIGFRNFQHFRSQAEAKAHLDRPAPQPAFVDSAKVLRVARYFNPAGQLIRWPGKFSHREPCLWVLWSKLSARKDLTEKQVNEQLLANHLFGDHALLRRELCDRGMLWRTPDGRTYRRIERQPLPEALALIRHLGSRQAA